jgi:hypothetical protein
LCSDGVVVGTDSAMVAGRLSTGYTVERQDGDVLKIEIIDNNIITAVTGAMGLAQRFNEHVTETIRTLRQPLLAPQPPMHPMFIGNMSPLHNILSGKVGIGQVPYDVLNPVEIGRIIAQTTIEDFRRTQSFFQANNGWGLGALFAFVNSNAPQLIDFDPVQFHPELKGLPDPSRGDQDRNWRCVSWGAGQKLGDPFLAHAYRILFGGKVPTVRKAKLLVVWTIDHVSRYNIGLVGGKKQLAVLERVAGEWTAQYADPGETDQQLKALEDYISEFVDKQRPDAASKASEMDIKQELTNALVESSEIKLSAAANIPSTGG